MYSSLILDSFFKTFNDVVSALRIILFFNSSRITKDQVIPLPSLTVLFTSFLVIIYTFKVIENEDKWLSYEEEETDVELEIADDVFNYLVNEFIEELSRPAEIISKSNQNSAKAEMKPKKKS
jgi:hypothetical protein